MLVACDEAELAALATYAQRAAANGVPLEPLDAAAIHRLEPAVRAVAGLYSASTGIIDSHGLMLALLGDAEQAGATLVTHTPALRRALAGLMNKANPSDVPRETCRTLLVDVSRETCEPPGECFT